MPIMLSDKVSHFTVRSGTEVIAAEKMRSKIKLGRVRARMPVYSVGPVGAIDR